MFQLEDFHELQNPILYLIDLVPVCRSLPAGGAAAALPTIKRMLNEVEIGLRINFKLLFLLEAIVTIWVPSCGRYKNLGRVAHFTA